MLLPLFFALSSLSAAISDDYKKSVLDWRADREQHLKEPDGYLALVALAWLKPGSNAIGSAPTSIVKLPSDFAARVGEFLVEGEDGKTVSLIPSSGASILVDGAKVQAKTSIRWGVDQPSTIGIGRLKISVARRNRGDGPRARVFDPDAPSLKRFKGVTWFAIDPKWRVKAQFTKLPAPLPTTVPNSIGTENDIVKVGSLDLRLGEQAITLTAFEGDAQGRLFVIFRDPTNGNQTYSAGRYLMSEAIESDGSVWLDFNLSYSPPCAFNKFTTCPYVPENKIPLAIFAGEQFGGKR